MKFPNAFFSCMWGHPLPSRALSHCHPVLSATHYPTGKNKKYAHVRSRVIVLKWCNDQCMCLRNMNLVCLLGLWPCIVSCLVVAGDCVWMPALVSANGVLYHGIEHKRTLRFRRGWDIFCNTCLTVYVNYWCTFRAMTHILTSISVTAFVWNTDSNAIHVCLVQWPMFMATILYIT